MNDHESCEWQFSARQRGDTRLTRANGSIQELRANLDSAEIAPGETVEVGWILRPSADAGVCPYLTAIPGENSKAISWSVVGASLSGTHSRALHASIKGHPDVTSDPLPLRDEETALSVGNIAGVAQDRDYGCNGLLQVWPNP